MLLALPGSTWKKWDLHVHTPESLVHDYPGEKEAAWQAFLADLEALPPEFKVLGINDYLFVDGYERVQHERRRGRLRNIELVLPVIELRMDKFGGVLEQGSDGSYQPSSWSRINLHVIFDEVEPKLITDQFMSAISRRYTLVSGASGKWGGVLTKENLIALGKAVIASLPDSNRTNAHSPLKAGFNNLNVSYEGLREALENPLLAGKFVVAIGKSEWDCLRWNDNNIADKKTVINEADLVFTASANPEAYAKARRKLVEAGVNAKLLDCSDAHRLSTSAQKDRIGNCFTWIKADSTFEGLVQAIQEFDDRIYVGDNPPKRALVEHNKTKFIGSVRVAKKQGSTLSEPWFNVELPLNPNLVAIIGNKGSGKSALSDVVALVGNTRHHEKFSFLKTTRFRNPKTKFAQHFVGELTWQDGSSSSRDLDKDPDPSGVERVKYLPQSYLEDLCNELGDGGSETFDAELRKIIYSHVPEAARLGKASMDELLDFKVAEFNQARQALRHEVSKANTEILEAERRSTPEFKRSLEEQLAAKRAELNALDGAKPQAIEDPNASQEAQAESKQAAERIEALEGEIRKIEQEEACLREKKVAASKQQAIAKRIAQALTNHHKQHQTFLGELKPLLAELSMEIPIELIVQLRIDLGPLEALVKEMQSEVDRIDASLQSEEHGSYAKRKQEFAASIAEAKSKLGERQRQFVLYKEELSKWEKAKAEVIGTQDKPGSITWLQAEIESLANLPKRLEVLKKTRSDLAAEIHNQIRAMVDEYRRLYGPVQEFVNSPEQQEMNLPLDFQVRIEEAGFAQQLTNRINQRVRGSFSGVEESGQLLKTMLQEASFATSGEAVEFAERIDDMLHFDRREGQGGRDTRLNDQLRRGTTAQELLDFVFGFDYLSPRYSLTYAGQEIGQLSPGERGLLLLVFYLLVDKDDIPIVIDQPEENLDNQTIYRILVKCIKKAKERRQVIMVTHNPNLAVVCDAEQIIHASCEKQQSRFEYRSGAIEHPEIRAIVVDILEGTEPAFKNRQSKYRLR